MSIVPGPERARHVLSPSVQPERGRAALAVDRRNLARLAPLRRVPGRNWTKADIVVYRLDGVEIAIKDYAPRPWWVRQTLGRWLVRREVRAYRAAGDAPGLPGFHGRLDPFALVLDWIDARPVASLEPRSLGPECWDRLADQVAELHRRGIALADLHHRDVLIDAEGEVWIVDLALAWVSRKASGGLFARLCELDRLAVARIRARGLGRDPEQAVVELGGRAARWHRLGRRFKRLLRRGGHRS